MKMYEKLSFSFSVSQMYMSREFFFSTHTHTQHTPLMTMLKNTVWGKKKKRQLSINPEGQGMGGERKWPSIVENS